MLVRHVFARSSVLVAALLCATSASPSPAHGQETWTVRDEGARSAEIARRYQEILERRPEDGRILDMLVRELGSASAVQRLIDTYTERSAASPSDLAAHMLGGHLLVRQGREEEALVLYDRALAAAPDDPLVLRSAGRLYRRLDRREASRDLLGRALELTRGREERRELLRFLADLAFEARAWDEASGWVEQMVEEDPSNPYLRMELGELFVRWGRLDEAAAQYQALVDRAGRDTRQRAVALRDLGDIFVRMGRVDDAIARYEEGLRLVDRGYWLHRELQQSMLNAWRAAGRLPELAARYETEWRNPSADDLLLLASIQEELGRDADALATTREAARRGGGLDARLAVVRLLERQGDYDAVEDELRSLIRQNARDAGLRFRLADLQRRRGDTEGATRTLEETERSFSSDANVLSEVADRWSRLREGERAIATLERVVRVEPRRSEGWVALGSALFTEGRRTDAERVWRTLLTLESDRAAAHAAWGDVLADHGLLEEAIEAYAESTRTAPDSDTYLRGLARLEQQARRLPQALRSWDRLLERTTVPSLEAEARTAIVRIWSEQGRLRDRLTEVRRRFDADPAQRRIGHLLAEGLVADQQPSDAETVWRRLLETDANDVLALDGLERLYVAEGRIDDAMVILERIAEVEPRRAREVYHRLSTLALRRYDDDQALRWARLAVELNPDDATARAQLAGLLRQMHRLDESVEAWRAAIDLDPRAWRHAMDLADLLLAMGRRSEADELLVRVVQHSGDELLLARAGRRLLRVRESDGDVDGLAMLFDAVSTDARVQRTASRMALDAWASYAAQWDLALRWGDPSERARARTELDTTALRASRSLSEAVTTDDVTARAAALRLAMLVRSPAVTPALVRLLDDPDVTLREGAARALAEGMDGSAIPAVQRALASATPAMRPMLLTAIATARGIPTDPAWRAPLLDAETDPELRAALLLAAAASGEPDLGPALRMALDGDSLPLRRAALIAASQVSTASIAADLRMLVERGDPLEASLAAVALGRETQDTLLWEAWIEGDPALQRAAAAALSRSHVRDEPFLAMSLTSITPEASSAGDDWSATLATRHLEYAFRADATCPSPPPPDALHGSVQRAIGARGARLERLARAFAPGDALHLPGLDACAALGEVGSAVRSALDDARPALRALAATGGPADRRHAMMLLGVATVDAATWDTWVARVSDPDTGVARAAVRHLRGHAPAWDTVRGALVDPRWEVREAAAYALTARPDEALPLLDALAQNDPSAAVRASAWATRLELAPDETAPLVRRAWSGWSVAQRVELARGDRSWQPPTRTLLWELAAADASGVLRQAAAELR